MAENQDNDQQAQLLAVLKAALPNFDDYQQPIVRADGDIVIPLDPVLKKNRAAFKGLADAFSEMMKHEVRPKRSSTWVE